MVEQGEGRDLSDDFKFWLNQIKAYLYLNLGFSMLAYNRACAAV